MNLSMIEREMATARRTLLFLSDSISQCAVERYLTELEKRRLLCASVSESLRRAHGGACAG